MEKSDVKSRWIKFKFERGPVWSLSELMDNEPPTGVVNQCGVLLNHAHIVIHDEPNISLIIYLCKYNGLYCTGVEGENTEGYCGGHGYYPGISEYHTKNADKMEAVKYELTRELKKKDMKEKVRKSIKEALEKLEDLKRKREPVQLLIEW